MVLVTLVSLCHWLVKVSPDVVVADVIVNSPKGIRTFAI